ncbi:MAG: hypothetical protein ACRDUV_07515 [Pseudonocardiaceae bacterium]
MTAVATSIFAIPRLSRGARAALLTVHVAVSVGWLGLDGALVALEVTGLTAGDPAVQGGIADAMGALASWVLIPVVFTSLVSGVVLALSTPWGLVRHWWVLAKCAIAVTLTATGLLLMLPRLDQVVAAEGEPVQMQTLLARSLALVLLLAATGISVIKPWGKTPHGRAVQAAGKRPVKRPDHLVQQK